MPSSNAAAFASIPFSHALKFWLKLGFISFGGPAGQIAIMHQELVERRRWIGERRFLHALNYCMVLPGPEAQQLATYIGWLMHGVRGGIMAGVLFVLPSLFVLIALAWIYLVFKDVPLVDGILYGIKPAVIAIVLFAAFRIGARTLTNSFMRVLAVAAFIAIFVFAVPFPYIVLAAGVLGYFAARVAPGIFHGNSSHGSSQKNYGPALIDDDTPLPEHARLRWSRVIAYGILGISLWAVVEGLLVILFGWEGPLAQMGWFFTKAAFLTFGGAYAVLPYVYQGAVEHYQWLTASQMIDGLALGETTPGPLIMIVAFVGFVGGWTHQLFGSEGLLAAGIAGACVATFFTFLPSFLFILIGAPAIESTRSDIKLAAPFTAITAAVVGVIANLALFFAYHVFWPKGFEGNFEWFAVIMSATAFVALWRFKMGVIPIIAAAALLGVLYRLLPGFI